jgi:hypothetical protein
MISARLALVAKNECRKSIRLSTPDTAIPNENKKKN